MNIVPNCFLYVEIDVVNWVFIYIYIFQSYVTINQGITISIATVHRNILIT